MTYADYIAYFRAAAVSNKLLAHNPGAGINRFRVMTTEEVIMGDAHVDLKEIGLFLENPSIRPEDLLSDNPRKILTGSLMILKDAGRESFETRQQYIQDCFVIAEQMLAKMRNDTSKMVLQGFDLNGMNMEVAGPLFGQWWGWRVEFPLNQSWTNNLILNNDDWTNDTKWEL